MPPIPELYVLYKKNADIKYFHSKCKCSLGVLTQQMAMVSAKKILLLSQNTL